MPNFSPEPTAAAPSVQRILGFFLKKYLISIFLGLMALAGCGRSGSTIVFILPNNFQGLFLISEDPQRGLEFTRTNNQYYIEIPRSGQFVAKTLKPFTEWHKFVARYSNGDAIAWEAPNPTQAAIYELPNDTDQGFFFFIGTRAEFDLLSKRDHIKSLPLGQKLNP